MSNDNKPLSERVRAHEYYYIEDIVVTLADEIASLEQRLENAETRLAAAEAAKQSAIDAALVDLINDLGGLYVHREGHEQYNSAIDDVAKFINGYIGANPLAEAQARIAELEAMVVSAFSHPHPPVFKQGLPTHEDEEVLTAENAQYMANNLADLRDEADGVGLAEAQARIAELESDLSAFKHAFSVDHATAMRLSEKVAELTAQLEAARKLADDYLSLNERCAGLQEQLEAARRDLDDMLGTYGHPFQREWSTDKFCGECDCTEDHPVHRAAMNAKEGQMNDTQKVIEELKECYEALDRLAIEAGHPKVRRYAGKISLLASRLEAEQKREPVAWQRFDENGRLFDVCPGTKEPVTPLHGKNVPLYTHPPADAATACVLRDALSFVENAVMDAEARHDITHDISNYERYKELRDLRDRMIVAAKGE